MKIHLKNCKIYFELLISPSFDELHCSTIVHINHMEPMFQDLPFIAPRSSPKNLNKFFDFCHGVGTRFLVLAHILIYTSLGIGKTSEEKKASFFWTLSKIGLDPPPVVISVNGSDAL